MRRTWFDVAATGVGLGVLLSGGAAVAHTAGGGSWPELSAVVTVGTVVGVIVAALSRRGSLSFGQLVALVAGVQVLVHLLSDAGLSDGAHQHGPADGGHGPIGGEMAAPMVFTHVVATVVVAVCGRWGWRWLSTMPQMARAWLLRVVRPVVVVVVPLGWSVADGGDVAAGSVAVLVRAPRGPPER